MQDERGKVVAAAIRFLSNISFGTDEYAGAAGIASTATGNANNILIEGIAAANNGKLSRLRSRREWVVGRYVKGCDLHSVPAQGPIMLTTAKGTPLLLMSLIGYHHASNHRLFRLKAAQKTALLGNISSADFLASRKKAQSYRHLLFRMENEMHSHGEEESDAASSKSSKQTYDPNFLDDPELRTGKHRTVVALPSFLGSINHYTRSSDLKRELNEQFKAKHADINPSLTLSQIRNLKQHLLNIGLATNLELSTIAKTYTFFEKLFLQSLISKSNRKLVAACCLLLACKANDSKDTNYTKVLYAVSNELGLEIADISRNEFSVFAALEFSLHIPASEYIPHFERIFNSLEYSNVQEYLGEKMYSLWKCEVGAKQ